MPSTARKWLKHLGLLVLLTVAAAGPASAHRMHLNEMITESSIQRTLVRMLGADIMRVGLKIDDSGSMARLVETRARLIRSFEVLSEGVAEVRQSGQRDADTFVLALSDATYRWAGLDDSLEPVLRAGALTARQARELFDLTRQLGHSVDALHMHFHHAADHYGVVTVIGMAIMTTERERALSQRITGDFLALAVDGDDEDRAVLSAAAAEFDRYLRALQNGDPALGLIPAPTVELRGRLSQAELHWRAMTSYLDAAAAGRRIRRAEIEAMSDLSARLLDELGQAGEILAGLLPPRRS